MLNLQLFWRLSAAIGLALVLCGGCMSSADAVDEDTTGGVVSGVDASIGFEHEGTLTLQPTEQVEVVVHTSPTAKYDLSFHLVGDALDASLDLSQAVTDDDGVGRVVLRAPGMATTFVLRATIRGGPSAELQVAVSNEGFGTFNVLPIYHGNRPVDSWTVNVFSATSCDALAAMWPEEPPGPFTATSSGDTGLVVSGLPVGPNLTVAIRAQHYLWGCTDETNLKANALMDLSVLVVNKPVNIENVVLNVTFDFSPNTAPYSALLDEHLKAMLNRFGNNPSDTAVLLLAQMAQVNGTIDPNVHAPKMTQHLTDKMVALASVLDELANKGMAAQPATITGTLSVTDPKTGTAQLALSSIAGVSASAMNIALQDGLSLAIDPDDTVRLGGSIEWLPSRLLGGAISAQAVMDYPNQLGVAEVLAMVVECSSITFSAGSQCDTICVRQACRQALQTLWDATLNESTETLSPAQTHFEAAGQPSLADDATLTGFHGNWLGKVTSGSHICTVTGSISATQTYESGAMQAPPKP